MDNLIAKYDINQIEFEDNRSEIWSMVWTNREGDPVSERGEGIDELEKVLKFATENLDGKNFRLIMGGAYASE